ncbi:MAG: His/Gly/Thr/Pro-type tRNA ligase C-terminal domain-containing protein, partial [Actinomycetota bacterium]
DGIVWPAPVAPFGAGIINMRPTDEAVSKACEETYAALAAAGFDPLYDETEDRAGAKFARMDLIGLPWQVIIGPKGVGKGVVELKERATGERSELPLAEAVAKMQGAS